MQIGSVLNVQLKAFTRVLDDKLDFKMGCIAGSEMKIQYAFALCLPLAPPLFFFMNYALFNCVIKPKLRRYSDSVHNLRKETGGGCCGSTTRWFANLKISFDKTLNCVGMQ